MQSSGALVALVVALDGDAARGERWASLSAPFMRFVLAPGVGEAAETLAGEDVDAVLVDVGAAATEVEGSLRRIVGLAGGRPLLVVAPAEAGSASAAGRVAADAGISVVADGGPAEICRAIRHVVAECRRREAERSADRLDALTGVLGREAFREEVATRLSASWTSSAAMVLDVDKLSTVNDLIGRDAADRSLAALAERLNGALRDDEVLGVADAGRFLFWMPVGAFAERAPLRARELLEVVARPMPAAGRRLNLTAAAGVAFHPMDAAGIDTLVARAEAAMYRAKADGPNTYRLHQTALIGAAPAQLKKRAVARREIDRNSLELVFEPQLDLRTERPRAARLRLRSRSDGALIHLSADEIDDLALPIIRWTLETAGAQMAGWLAQEVPLVPLVVDLPLQLVHRSDVVEMVRRRLQSAGCHPAWFEVAVKSDVGTLQVTDAITADHLQALRDLGLRVTLSGCGGRTASLGMIRDLPADAIELAADLVEGRRHRASDATVLAALVDLALVLGLEVGAAGVDRPGLARELKDLGCDWASGAWVGVPMPAAAFSDWLSGGGTLMSAAS